MRHASPGQRIAHWFLIGNLLYAGMAGASDSPVTALADSPAFATEAQAAQAGLRVSVALSTEYEYGGAVLHCDSGYRYTQPVTVLDGYHVHFRIDVSTCALTAIYHTHPPGGGSGDFSPTDVETADALHVTSYLAVVSDGSFKVLRAGARSGASLGYVSDADALRAREAREAEQRAITDAAPGHWKGRDVRAGKTLELSVDRWKQILKHAARVVRVPGQTQVYDRSGQATHIIYN